MDLDHLVEGICIAAAKGDGDGNRALGGVTVNQLVPFPQALLRKPQLTKGIAPVRVSSGLVNYDLRFDPVEGYLKPFPQFFQIFLIADPRIETYVQVTGLLGIGI